jgi:hypothetical protein
MLEDRPVAPPPKGTYQKDGPGNLEWNKGAAWTGDQGLFLGAMSLLSKYINDLETMLNVPTPEILVIGGNIKSWMRSITAGIVNVLAVPNVDNVLREPPYAIFYTLGGDPEDYLCGRGVLARNVILPDTIVALNAVGVNMGQVFGPTFAQSAKNAAVYRDPNAPQGQLAADWHPILNVKANTAFWAAWDPQNATKLSYNWRIITS